MTQAASITTVGKHARHASSASIHATHTAHMHYGAHAAAPKPLVISSKTSMALRGLAVILITIAIAIGIGIGFASAGNQGVLPETDSSMAAHPAAVAAATASDEGFILETTAYRDMSTAISDVQAQEEAARIAAEEKARAEEQAAIKRAQAAQARSAANGGVGVYDVDFSIGKDAFISEWTTRIDKYLAGSPLAGHGSTFAEAAWEYGVDPRWSPAISNTESTKGSNCFAWHNAWGWTGGSWASWSSAINAHVSGLASRYGFTISYANAMTYCPPNYHNWYYNTLGEMRKI